MNYGLVYSILSIHIKIDRKLGMIETIKGANMETVNFDMIIAVSVMLVLNCRGYYKCVMGKQLSECEVVRRKLF